MAYINLEESLKKRLENSLKNMKLQNTDKEFVSINVLSGYLPQKNFNYSKIQIMPEYSKFPFVMICNYKGKIKKKSILYTKLLIGIVAGDEEKTNLEEFSEAHKYLLSIIQKIKLEIQKNPQIGDYVTYNSFFKWKIKRKQALPFMYGEIKIKFRVPEIKIEEDRI